MRSLATALAVLAVTAASASAAPPVATLSLNKHALGRSEGGLTATVTVDTAPGPLADGRVVSYRFSVINPDGSYGGRCGPSPKAVLPPPVANVPTTVDIRKPAAGWCRGDYAVRVDPRVDGPCTAASPPRCGTDADETRIAGASFTVGHPERTRCYRAGPIRYCHWPAVGRRAAYWLIDQDLVDYIRGHGGTNFTLEEYVRRVLARRAPATARRMRWDSEADYLVAIASRREDIVRTARVLNALHREQRG